jgi:Niemann-Pick C1 protein
VVDSSKYYSCLDEFLASP